MSKKTLEQLKKEALAEIKAEESIVKKAESETMKAKNPVQPKAVAKVSPKVSIIKTKMSIAERYDDVKKKLGAFEVLVEAYPLNSCFITTRDRLKVKLEKLDNKKNKK